LTRSFELAHQQTGEVVLTAVFVLTGTVGFLSTVLAVELQYLLPGVRCAIRLKQPSVTTITNENPSFVHVGP
jgi:hypothetical protein